MENKSRCSLFTKGSNMSSRSTSSETHKKSARDYAIEERVKLAELQVELEYHDEETIIRRLWLEKETARSRARLKVYENIITLGDICVKDSLLLNKVTENHDDVNGYIEYIAEGKIGSRGSQVVNKVFDYHDDVNGYIESIAEGKIGSKGGQVVNKVIDYHGDVNGYIESIAEGKIGSKDGQVVNKVIDYHDDVNGYIESIAEGKIGSRSDQVVNKVIDYHDDVDGYVESIVNSDGVVNGGKIVDQNREFRIDDGFIDELKVNLSYVVYDNDSVGEVRGISDVQKVNEKVMVKYFNDDVKGLMSSKVKRGNRRYKNVVYNFIAEYHDIDYDRSEINNYGITNNISYYSRGDENSYGSDNINKGGNKLVMGHDDITGRNNKPGVGRLTGVNTDFAQGLLGNYGYEGGGTRNVENVIDNIASLLKN